MRTLQEYADLSNDALIAGYVETILKESPLMDRIKWDNLVGNATWWNREDEDNPPGIRFYQPGEVWQESTGKTTKHSVTLVTMGGDVDTDLYAQLTRSNINDQHKIDIKMKAKAMARFFEEKAVYGRASAGEFDGLHAWVATLPTTQQLHMGSGTAGAPLTIKKLHQLCDAIRGGPPDILLMNRQTRLNLQMYLEEKAICQTERDRFGRLFTLFRDIPCVVSDHLTQTERLSSGAYAGPTGGNTTSIFAIRFDDADGVIGFQNGEIRKRHWPELESKNAMRTRFYWYLTLACLGAKCLARLDGITDAPVTSV